MRGAGARRDELELPVSSPSGAAQTALSSPSTDVCDKAQGGLIARDASHPSPAAQSILLGVGHKDIPDHLQA